MTLLIVVLATVVFGVLAVWGEIRRHPRPEKPETMSDEEYRRNGRVATIAVLGPGIALFVLLLAACGLVWLVMWSIS